MLQLFADWARSYIVPNAPEMGVRLSSPLTVTSCLWIPESPQRSY